MKESAPRFVRLGQRSRQRGAIAIMSAALVLLILGFFALAIDLSRVYNRRAELHTAADAAAIAAADKLNGTAAGVAAALAAARGLIEDGDNGPRYMYVNKMRWDDAAIAFSTSRDGAAGWRTSTQASAAPAGLMVAKVDTSALDDSYGLVQAFFAPLLSAGAIQVGHVAVAGRSRVNVTPFAVCAMSTDPHAKRTNTGGSTYDELVEYGFRRGISYNLMRLNPNGTSPLNFQVDPVALAGNGSSSTHFNAWLYEPYICSGTMTVPRVTGASVGVQSPFPIGTYYTHLNSRFDPYTGSCDLNAAPPDTNVKQYPYASISWMSPKPASQSATSDTAGDTRLQTIADAGPPNHPAIANYGPLWSFARAVPWSSYEQQGSPEPAGGYTTFSANTTVWRALYGTDAGATTGTGSYPSATPYLATSGSTFVQTPGTSRSPGSKFRRVLNVPLLACPVTGSAATVLAVGKFFMTVPADATSIYAEFGGVATEDALGGRVEIFQ